ncbi:MAG: cytochrome b N-terminal domain-containing protein [Thermoprotei archaeon]
MSSKKKGIFSWITDRMERMLFNGAKFIIPKKPTNPLAYLGMLTFMDFLLLGITGALLTIYYTPTFELNLTNRTFTSPWNSVKTINDVIAFGYILRNIHYHASNAMVLLAILHLSYQLFSGRYKLKNELIWVTGVVFGLITILEAYSGYDLIVNVRAQLAMNVGRGLALNTPFLGDTLANLLFGPGSLSSMVIHLYAFHIFLLPFIMVLLAIFHFPRNLTLDIPMVSVIIGIIFIVAGIYPVELGSQFNPFYPAPVTVPEWYLTALYAFLRTGLSPFLVGVLIPTLYIIAAAIIPFLDKSRGFKISDRPLVIAIGVTGLVQFAFFTIWGFQGTYPWMPLMPLPGEETLLLFLDPITTFAVWGMLIVICILTVYIYSYNQKRKSAKPLSRSINDPTKPKQLSPRTLLVGLVGLVTLQAFLTIVTVMSYMLNLQNIALITLGSILITFGFIYHFYRMLSS